MNRYILYFLLFTQLLSCDLSGRRAQPNEEDKNLKAFEKILTSCKISKKNRKSIIDEVYQKRKVLIEKIISDFPNQFNDIVFLCQANKYKLETVKEILIQYFDLMQKYYNSKKKFDETELIYFLLSIVDNNNNYSEKLKEIIDLNNSNNQKKENEKIYAEIKKYVLNYNKLTTGKLSTIKEEINKCLEKYDKSKTLKIINSIIKDINNDQISKIINDLNPYEEKYKTSGNENITKTFDDLFKEIEHEKQQNTIMNKLTKCLRTLRNNDIQKYIKEHINKILADTELFDIEINGIIEKQIRITIKYNEYKIIDKLNLNDINLQWENDYELKESNQENFTLQSLRKSNIVDCFRNIEKLSQTQHLDKQDFYSLFFDYLEILKNFLSDVHSISNSLNSSIKQFKSQEVVESICNAIQDKVINYVLPYEYVNIIYTNNFLNSTNIKEHLQEMFKNMGFDSVVIDINTNTNHQISFSELKIDSNDLVKNQDMKDALDKLSNFISQKYQEHIRKFNTNKEDDIENIFKFKTIYNEYIKQTSNFDKTKNKYENDYKLLTFKKDVFSGYKDHIKKIKTNIINYNFFSSKKLLKNEGLSAIRTVEDLNLWMNNTYDIIAGFYSFIDNNDVQTYKDINEFLKSIFGVKDKTHEPFIVYKNSHLLLYMFYSEKSYHSAFDTIATKLEFNTYKTILNIAFQKDNFLKCSDKVIKLNDISGSNGYIQITSGKDYNTFNELKSEITIIKDLIKKAANDNIIYVKNIQENNLFKNGDVLFDKDDKDNLGIHINKIALFFGYDKFENIKINYKSDTGMHNNESITKQIV